MTSTSIATPFLVPALGVRFTAIRAANLYTCAIADDATVFCWGATTNGQCGIDGTATGTARTGPVRIPGLDHVRLLETAFDHACAVRTSDPTLVCWVATSMCLTEPPSISKLGPTTGALKRSAVPIEVEIGNEVLDIGIGVESTFALAKDGRTYAWGFNDRGNWEPQHKIPKFAFLARS